MVFFIVSQVSPSCKLTVRCGEASIFQGLPRVSPVSPWVFHRPMWLTRFNRPGRSAIHQGIQGIQGTCSGGSSPSLAASVRSLSPDSLVMVYLMLFINREVLKCQTECNRWRIWQNLLWSMWLPNHWCSLFYCRLFTRIDVIHSIVMEKKGVIWGLQWISPHLQHQFLSTNHLVEAVWRINKKNCDPKVVIKWRISRSKTHIFGTAPWAREIPICDQVILAIRGHYFDVHPT